MCAAAGSLSLAVSELPVSLLSFSAGMSQGVEHLLGGGFIGLLLRKEVWSDVAYFGLATIRSLILS